MTIIPTDTSPEGTLGLLADGYEFISKRCRRLGSDAFRTRLLLHPTLCMRGHEAAKLFYDTRRFARAAAAPARLRGTLTGSGGVQGLDGAAHDARKAMFLTLMSDGEMARLADLTRAELRRAARGWEERDRVVLFDALMRVLCRAVCEWAGVPLAEDELGTRTAQMAAMIDAPGGIGPRVVRGRIARIRAEAWIERLVEQVRTHELEPREAGALAHIARHRDIDGEPLSPHDAAVEILNVLRPTVAVARFLVFAALALHHHPEHVEELRSSGDGAVWRFAQEVRRYYPFFPFAVARSATAFSWRGARIEKGERALLDLYGTDHDERLWEEPYAFRPERFARRSPDAFDLIPQGGGDTLKNHRCAGERPTLMLLQVALEELTRALSYDVPEQDLNVDLARIPAIPRSRFVIADVRLGA